MLPCACGTVEGVIRRGRGFEGSSCACLGCSGHRDEAHDAMLTARATGGLVRGQVVLSCTQDEFFAKSRYANFGDLGVAVKGLMDEYQKATRLNENIQSIDDMQAFLER